MVGRNSVDALERGIELFLELIGEDERLEVEFESTLGLFAPRLAALDSDLEGERLLAERRHLEWFLFERPSPALGGVPAEVLQEPWLGRAGPLERECLAAYLGSRAGAFEVSSIDVGEGVVLRDLFTLAEISAYEPEAWEQFEPGDMVVGRVFPIEPSTYQVSPAASCFRDRALLHALAGDLERMRGSRRGVLRIEQLELERIFFRSGAEQSAPPPRESRAHARSELLLAGLTAEDVERVERSLVSSIARSEHRGTEVTSALNRLAFETEVELENARIALIELWGAHVNSRGKPSFAPLESTGEAAQALASFDEGRARGGDLEQLFRDLERDLGLDGLEDADEDDPAPDFPGVVGAMVEEFLWDLAREQGEEAARRWAPLRLFSRYGASIGVFENLGAVELIDFAGRFLIDEAGLDRGAEAEIVLQALAEFCRWCEERHAHALWTEFESAWHELARSVPRLIEARRALAPTPAETLVATSIRSVAPTKATLLAKDRREFVLELPSQALQQLAVGDLVLLDEGTSRIAGVYPKELEFAAERRTR